MVLDLLNSDGYEAVQLRTVAARAHVSLTRIYRYFPTRDELIIAALAQWMDENAYAAISPPDPDATLRDSLMDVLRCVFEPWERSPKMLEAYHHARTGPRGGRLDEQGLDVVLPVAGPILRDLDSAYVADLALILGNLALALIGRFATGSMEITDILPTLERTVYRLTADNATASARKTDLFPPS